jgi:RHS repeat-associated protein
VTYAPDGAILSTKDSVNGNWTYTYDDFARLTTSNNSAPSQGFSYVYDQYGNRWQQNLTAGSGGTSILTFSNNSSAGTNGNCYHAAGVTNQPDGYCYDAAGNLLNDGTHSYTYDAENRIISVDSGQTATYTYNAEGQRIRNVSSAGTADYLYDLAGHQITQLNGSGGDYRNEIYAGGRHVATYRSSTTYFVQSDWQGTERAVTSLNGAQCETVTNLPFGDSQATNGSCGDPSPMHFTGQQRDTETNLDYFGGRFYASAMGRFVTPDWDGKPVTVPYADFGDPQSLNLYAYVRNSPVVRVDLTGHNYAGMNGLNADHSAGLPMFQDDGTEADAEQAEREYQQQQQQQQQSQQPAQNNNTVTVTVDQVKSANPFGHVVIQIDKGPKVGLVADSDKAAAAAVAKETASAAAGHPTTDPVPGHVEPLAANRTKDIKNTVVLHVTRDQAKKMQATINDSMKNLHSYDPGFHNCASFVEDVLRSGGVRAPNDMTPGGLVDDLKQNPK